MGLSVLIKETWYNAENFAIIQLSSISGAEDHPVKRMPRDHVVHTANFQVMLFVPPTNGMLFSGHNNISGANGPLRTRHPWNKIV